MGAKQNAAENALHDQTQLLPKRQLLVVFGIMALALLVCFIDQNGISVLLPSIARDLDARQSISWAGTSALIANTVFQVLYGRLSDLFGRKNIFISALVLLSLSDLACGLSVNSTMLYIFRGLAGVANGGITSLAMMIVSDVVTLQQRGKYQGILGCMVGLGNALGPIIASAFVISTTWRALFWLLAPLIMLSVVVCWFYLPSNMPKLNFRQTIAKIDFLGLLTGTVAIIFLLIPISNGGHSDMPWDSPVVISLLTIGGVSLFAFIIIEWKFATLPMMPLSMFHSPSVAAMMAQSFLLGQAFYALTYFLPLYYQNVRGKSPLLSAVLVLPLVLTQSLFSTSAGLYMSYMNRYVETIWVGFGIWTLGGGLLILADEHISLGLICLFLVLIGVGAGCTFQPTLVALQAHCPKSQRAIVVSNRNLFRCGGGAVGLAVSSAILAAVLRSSLPPELQGVAASTFATPDLKNFSPEQREIIVGAYAAASRAVFIYFVPLTGLCFALTIFVCDRGLVRKEEKVAGDEQKAAAVLRGENEEEPERADLEKNAGVVAEQKEPDTAGKIAGVPEEEPVSLDDDEDDEDRKDATEGSQSSRKASVAESETSEKSRGLHS